MSDKYDLAVIGGGPGGYVASLRAAQLGLKVILVDERGLGGTCLCRGCIPTKALLASASLFRKALDGTAFGVMCENVAFDLSVAVSRKNGLVKQLVNGIETLLKRRKVALVKGRAVFAGSHVVEVSGAAMTERVEAEKFIIATGSRPACIPGFEVDGKTVITSDEALDLESLPESVLIVGGGVIGVEFATFYSMTGVDVTIVEALDRLLLTSDKSFARQVALKFRKDGVAIRTKTRIASLSAVEGKARARLEGGEELWADKALVSVGRTACSDGIGLENAGVEVDGKGAVIVDERQRTNVDNIWAVGDVTGRYWLAHAASSQGMVAAEQAAGIDSVFDADVLPSCVFCETELAQVGLTEDECRRRGLQFRTGRFMFGASGKALAQGEGTGSVKIITEKEGDRILGCHIYGPHASDLVAEAALAMKNGIGAKAMAATIHAHPTLPEALHEACEAALGRPVHSM